MLQTVFLEQRADKDLLVCAVSLERMANQVIRVHLAQEEAREKKVQMGLKDLKDQMDQKDQKVLMESLELTVLPVHKALLVPRESKDRRARTEKRVNLENLVRWVRQESRESKVQEAPLVLKVKMALMAKKVQSVIQVLRVSLAFQVALVQKALLDLLVSQALTASLEPRVRMDQMDILDLWVL